MITFRSWSFFFFLSLIYCTIRTIMTTPRATTKIEINIITAIYISRFSDIFFMFVVKVLESTCHLARPNHNLKNDPSQGWKGDCLISAKPHNRTLKHAWTLSQKIGVKYFLKENTSTLVRYYLTDRMFWQPIIYFGQEESFCIKSEK